MNNKVSIDKWASDLDIDIIKNGEIFDVNVINRSIELILGTTYGERLFNPSFGCGLQLRLFEGITTTNAESILDEAIEAIKRWEDRILILQSSSKIILDMSNNSITLVIPYIIKKTGINSTFKKKVYTT